MSASAYHDGADLDRNRIQRLVSANAYQRTVREVKHRILTPVSVSVSP